MLNTAIKFEDYLDKTASAKTQEELFAIYKETVGSHGFDRILFCLATDHSDIGEAAGTSYQHNFPEAWMKYYFEKGFDRIDPVLFYCYNKLGGFRWAEIEERMPLMKVQSTCLRLGEEAGLNNGICAPLRGLNGAIAGLSLASTERKDAVDNKLDLITAYSNHFYIKYRQLGQAKTTVKKDVPNIALTDRERDVLCWMARGKSDNDIATILNLSRHGVNYHTRNIFTKLQVNDRILAIVKALTLGLIHP